MAFTGANHSSLGVANHPDSGDHHEIDDYRGTLWFRVEIPDKLKDQLPFSDPLYKIWRLLNPQKPVRLGQLPWGTSTTESQASSPMRDRTRTTAYNELLANSVPDTSSTAPHGVIGAPRPTYVGSSSSSTLIGYASDDSEGLTSLGEQDEDTSDDESHTGSPNESSPGTTIASDGSSSVGVGEIIEITLPIINGQTILPDGTSHNWGSLGDELSAATRENPVPRVATQSVVAQPTTATAQQFNRNWQIPIDEDMTSEDMDQAWTIQQLALSVIDPPSSSPHPERPLPILRTEVTVYLTNAIDLTGMTEFNQVCQNIFLSTCDFPEVVEVNSIFDPLDLQCRLIQMPLPFMPHMLNNVVAYSNRAVLQANQNANDTAMRIAQVGGQVAIRFGWQMMNMPEARNLLETVMWYWTQGSIGGVQFVVGSDWPSWQAGYDLAMF